MSMKPVNVEDHRILPQCRLPKIIFDYLEGLRLCRDAVRDGATLRPRVVLTRFEKMLSFGGSIVSPFRDRRQTPLVCFGEMT
jgi:hypothetical protein